MRSRHWNSRLAAGTVVAAAAILALVAGPITAGSRAAPASPISGPADPSIQACLAAHQVCDPAAEIARVAANAVAQTPSSKPGYLSRPMVEHRARMASITPLTPAAPSSAVVYSALLSRPDFKKLTGQASNVAINQARMVWVVTVHAPMATDGLAARPDVIKSVYSVAFDAATGQWTDMCIGCAWLSQSQ